ncbi:MAG: adenylate/guanylate cyclase domain-containing protein [Elusimicrobia bacterium]|nr:adenylate/guanylate cyclase domain-containing protein [Elusimicrobiota bacterium]
MHSQLVLLLAAPFLVQWTAGGYAGSGAAMLWGVLSPVCALVFVGPRGAVWWFGAYVALAVAAAFPDVAAGRAPQAFVEDAVLVASVLFFAMRYFVDEREKARAALAKEQEKSERLLLNILPKPIAERLKATGGVIADGFAQASVLFSDIVGFTPLSATMSPAELVAVLNKLFSAFDELAEKNGVEKIKTIGDAYMVCAGLPEPADDHARRAAEMALGMAGAVERFNAENKTTLQVRIGINSGPVVAGVIGLKKFVYDLWGDTVNTASRMESHSLAGRIQVTEATYDLLKDGYEFEDRGPIKVKGIGELRTFFLLGRKPA